MSKTARQPNTPADLIGRTIKDEKGRKYTYARFFRVGGTAAKNEVQREGERMKANKEIRNYRTRSYTLQVPTYPSGEFKRQNVWALFTR